MTSFEADVHADTSVDLATDPTIDLRSVASIGTIQEIDQRTLEGTTQLAVKGTAKVSGDKKLDPYGDSKNYGAVWCRADNDVYMMKSAKADGTPYFAYVLVFPDDMLVVAEHPHSALMQFGKDGLLF